jgi:hypothetical protein
MPTEDTGSYFRTRTVAQCFVETATLLYNTSLKEAPRRQPLLIVPFVVNASFACELFLKTLAHRGGVSLRGHNLSELLAALPVQERQRLDSAWTAASDLISKEVPETIESVVNELSTSFVDWRYSHEKERVSTASSSSILLLLEVLETASQ